MSEYITDPHIGGLAEKIHAAVTSPLLPAEAHQHPAFWEGLIFAHLQSRGLALVIVRKPKEPDT